MGTQVHLTNFATLYALHCWVCGVHFALPDELHSRAAKFGTAFHCPNGHSIRYADTEVERLRAELERTNRRLEFEKNQVAAAEGSARALRGQVTKLKKRAAAGLCPCCRRSFLDLRTHMKTKHPAYAEEAPSAP